MYMAYIKSKKMCFKKKSRKSRKMKRIRGGGEKGEGGETGAGNNPAATNGAGQEPAESSTQQAINLLTGLKSNLTTEPVTEADLDKIITVLSS